MQSKKLAYHGHFTFLKRKIQRNVPTAVTITLNCSSIIHQANYETIYVRQRFNEYYFPISTITYCCCSKRYKCKKFASVWKVYNGKDSCYYW